MVINKPFFEQNFKNNTDIMLNVESNDIIDSSEYRSNDTRIFSSSSYIGTSYWGCGGNCKHGKKYHHYYNKYVHFMGAVVYKGDVSETGDFTTLEHYKNTDIDNYNEGKHFHNIYDTVDTAVITVATIDYLNLLDYINTRLYDGTIETILESKSASIEMSTLTYMLFSKERIYVDKFYEIMYKNGIISIEQYNIGIDKTKMFILDGYDYSNLHYNWDSENSVYELSCDKSILLENRYESGEDIYLLFTPGIPLATSGSNMNVKRQSTPWNQYTTTWTTQWNNNRYNIYFDRYNFEESNDLSSTKPKYIMYTMFHNPDINKSVPQIPYMAFKISDVNGNGDIKLKQTNKIDVLDNFKVQIKVPYTI